MLYDTLYDTMIAVLPEAQRGKVATAPFLVGDTRLGGETWFWWACAAAYAATDPENAPAMYCGQTSEQLEARAIENLRFGISLGPPPGWEEIAAAWRPLCDAYSATVPA